MVVEVVEGEALAEAAAEVVPPPAARVEEEAVAAPVPPAIMVGPAAEDLVLSPRTAAEGTIQAIVFRFSHPYKFPPLLRRLPSIRWIYARLVSLLVILAVVGCRHADFWGFEDRHGTTTFHDKD